MASILVIDDDGQTRRWLRRVLEEAGYTVMEACNGRVALRRLQRTPTDLMILDIFMPEEDGLGTLRELRREYSATRVIAISGGGTMGDINYLTVATLLGARHVLQKPFDSTTLLLAVRQQLGQ